MVLASRSVSEQHWQDRKVGDWGEGRRANARMRRCLILHQGASPLRPPAPFPSTSMVWGEGNLSRVRKPRKSSAPLTDCLHPWDNAPMRRERGPKASGACVCLPLVGPRRGREYRGRKIVLDKYRPSHGRRGDAEEARRKHLRVGSACVPGVGPRRKRRQGGAGANGLGGSLGVSLGRGARR